MDSATREKFLESFRRLYTDGLYGTEQGNRTLERKARILNLNFEECKAEIERVLNSYKEYRETLIDFLEIGPLTPNQIIELNEIKEDLSLGQEEIDFITNQVYTELGIEPKGNEPALSPASTNTPVPAVFETEVEEEIEDEIEEDDDDDDFEDDDEDDDNEEDAEDLDLYINGNWWFHEIDPHAANDRMYFRFLNHYFDIEEAFLKKYKNFSGLESMLAGIDDVIIDSLFTCAGDAIDTLRRHNILEYSEADLVKSAFNEYGDDLDQLKDRAYDFLESIAENSAQIDAYRTARRQSRGKFVGFGSQGIVNAGAANLAIGTVHGVFNLIGKGFTAMGNSMKKSEQFKKMEEPFKDILDSLCHEIYDAMASALQEHGHSVSYVGSISDRYQKAKTMIENALNAGYTGDMLLDVIDKSLSLYAYDNELAYQLLFKMAISPQNDAKENLENMKQLNRFTDFWSRNEFKDTAMVNEKYSLILTQLVNGNPPQDKLLTRIAALDRAFFWNEEYHEDIKRELVYQHPGLEFMLKEEVKGMVGSAFLNYAIAQYRSFGTNPFGDRFYSLDNPAIQTKANAAIDAYATGYDPTERIIFLYDDTAWGSGKAGFLITEKHVYAKGLKLRVDEVKDISYSTTLGVHYIKFNLASEYSLTMLDKKYIDGFKRFMITLFQQQDDQHLEQSVAFQEVAKGLQEVSAAAPSQSAAAQQSNTNVNVLFKNLRGSSIKDNVYDDFTSGKGMKKLANVTGSYAKIGHDETPLFLFDNTAFGSAKEGLLITNRAIYAKSAFEKPLAIGLTQIQTIELEKSSLIVNGNKIDITLISKGDREEFFGFVKAVWKALK